MKTPLPIATLSRFSRIHAIWPSERPSIASPLTPARIASGAADSGVISSGAAMMDSISWLFADRPLPVTWAGQLALPLPGGCLGRHPLRQRTAGVVLRL